MLGVFSVSRNTLQATAKARAPFGVTESKDSRPLKNGFIGHCSDGLPITPALEGAHLGVGAWGVATKQVLKGVVPKD